MARWLVCIVAVLTVAAATSACAMSLVECKQLRAGYCRYHWAIGGGREWEPGGRHRAPAADALHDAEVPRLNMRKAAVDAATVLPAFDPALIALGSMEVVARRRARPWP
jgi:hypothetical protein